MNNVSVVYTPFTNLKKTARMEVGQVGFHSQKKVGMQTRRARPESANGFTLHTPSTADFTCA